MRKLSVICILTAASIAISVAGDDPVAAKLGKRLIQLRNDYRKSVAEAKSQAVSAYTALMNDKMDKHDLGAAEAIKKKIEMLKGKNDNKTFIQYFNHVYANETKKYADDPDLVKVGEPAPKDPDVVLPVSSDAVVDGQGQPGKNPYNNWGEEHNYKMGFVGQKEWRQHVKIMKNLGNLMGVEQGDNEANNYGWVLE